MSYRPIFKHFRFIPLCALGLSLVAFRAFSAEPPKNTEAQKEIRAAIQAGKNQEAVQLLTKEIGNEPAIPANYYARASLYDLLKEPAKAVADYTKVLELDPGFSEVYMYRGMVQFKRANIKESIADFDAYLKLKPSEAPNLWQRGISYYYAKQYAEGRKQFELHQMVNSDDVENAVWHFLCVAKIEGKEKARALLMPVGKDFRIPMVEIYALFAGRGTPEQVFQAVERGEVSAGIRRQRQFYANLYLGLYYEAMGDPVKAEEHITQAVGPYKVDHYMGDVARVHAKLRGYAIAKE